MRILMVEDEKYLSEAVAAILKKNNYTVDLAFDGEFGLDCGLSNIYDIIILDIMLPKMDGISVLKNLRKNNINIPIILLTAKSEISDKVFGLDNGADDYLVKPFKMEELLARLRALSRRNGELLNDNILCFGNIEYNPRNLMIFCELISFNLTLKEGQLLEFLLKNRNLIVSKDLIIEKIWGYETEADDNHVEVYISFLRKKLTHINANIFIQTVRGAGYILKLIN